MKRNSFDVITSFDMLEHIASPVSLVSAAFDLLKPGGVFVITVPRLDRYPELFDIEADFPPHHYTIWTRKALSALLMKAGFNQINILEKPLTAEDILFHLRWRFNRLLRKAYRFDKEQTERGSEEIKHRQKKRLTAGLKDAAWIVINVINWIFKVLKLGRGHTLMVLAKK
jgi:SAM-dependent methyltransferase